MKTLNLIIAWLLLLTVTPSCQEEEPELGALYVPSSLSVAALVSEDGSGLVQFQATASKALNYHFYFGNSSGEDPFVSSDGKASN